MGRPEQFHIRAVRFVGEQDGTPERELKQALQVLLSEAATVSRAYLARLQYDDAAGDHVALCLAATTASPDLARRIASEFSRRFNASVHLDIMFLSPQQEAECKKVCRQFYEAG